MTVKKHTIQNKLMYQGAAMVEIDIAYPHFEDFLLNREHSRFNQYYENEVRRLIRYAKDVLYPYAIEQYKVATESNSPFNHYTLSQVYEVTYNTSSLLSLLVDVHEDTGGIHGNINRVGNTWNMQLGDMLSLADLFVLGYDYMNPILGYIEVEARRKKRNQEMQYFDDLLRNLHDYADEKNYCLTNRGLAVFYQLRTIGSIGIQVFIIPYITFASNLIYPRIWLVDWGSLPAKYL